MERQRKAGAKMASHKIQLGRGKWEAIRYFFLRSKLAFMKFKGFGFSESVLQVTQFEPSLSSLGTTELLVLFSSRHSIRQLDVLKGTQQILHHLQFKTLVTDSTWSGKGSIWLFLLFKHQVLRERGKHISYQDILADMLPTL